MTDPSNNNEAAPAATEDQVVSFSWWLCMLPFVVAIGVFVYKWWMDKASTHWLLYAGGTLLIGLLFTAMVNSAAGGAEAAGTTSGGTGSETSTTSGGTDKTG